LARELGSTREVISRLLKSLESESKIKLGQKMIVINKK
jgi:CRP/FNR family transcriptional regulator